MSAAVDALRAAVATGDLELAEILAKALLRDRKRRTVRAVQGTALDAVVFNLNHFAKREPQMNKEAK